MVIDFAIQTVCARFRYTTLLSYSQHKPSILTCDLLVELLMKKQCMSFTTQCSMIHYFSFFCAATQIKSQINLTLSWKTKLISNLESYWKEYKYKIHTWNCRFGTQNYDMYLMMDSNIFKSSKLQLLFWRKSKGQWIF